MPSVAQVFTGWFFVTVMVGDVAIGVETPVVNIALNKPITAEITCGTPTMEFFYGHQQINLRAEDREISVCEPGNGTFAHPASLMVDQQQADTYTWWQSTSLNNIRSSININLDPTIGLDAVITIDLTDYHFVEAVTIQMGDSVRPSQMAVMKSSDGVIFTPWSYKVTSASECQTQFQIAPSTAVRQIDDVLCGTYSRNQFPRNEVISFELNNVAEGLREWQQTKYVRFQFFNMPQEFGLFANNFHHYTVQDIQVMAPCQCNDHASECVLLPSRDDPTKPMYQCVCGDNTQGMTCSECLPFFNQLPYQKGTNGFQCAECNCFSHSSECSYDPIVGSINGSINANGDLYGGGVCAGCLNNTSAYNCHECEMFYYRPAIKQQTDVDACQACDCHLPGTREDPQIGVLKGECIGNNDTALPPGMLPGDCYCKSSVKGMKCDECKDGFYDLTDANPNGCLSCNCFRPGTVNASNTCNKTSSGQCPCKTNTYDRRCDQCQPGFYGLAMDNPDGCTACSCDIGAAVDATCHTVNGQCNCRTNTGGRTCESVIGMSYYSTVHEISSEFDYIGHENLQNDADKLPGFRGYGYIGLTGSISTTTDLIVPTSQLNGSFQLVLFAANDGPSQVDIRITPIGDTEGLPQAGTANLPTCNIWCSQMVTPFSSATFDLGAGQWTVEAQINTQGGATVYLDYIVALPVEFSDPTELLGEARAAEFTATCDVVPNDMKLNTSEETICLSAVYSLTTYYFNGAKQCNCDPTGSMDNNCEPFGGQCRCKPGVGGRQCDACLPEYFNFRSTGCTACDCFTVNKVCDMTTGQCPCPPNTAGRRCDRCATFAWGLDEVNGCQECNCHPDGSISTQCDLGTGNCDCKPGVGTQTCSECEDGFKLLSDGGCQPCGCSIAGSDSTVCNKTDGQCPCKDNTGGLTCTDCAPGTFYNSPTQLQGCLECVCMGITTECDSSRARSVEYNIPTDASYSINWSLVTVIGQGEIPSPAVPTASVVNGLDVLTVAVPAGSALHWVVPDLTGNQLGTYGSLVTFSLFYLLDGIPFNPIEIEIRMILQGMGYRYTHIFGLNPPSTTTEFSVQMREQEWSTDPTLSVVSRGEFLHALVNIDTMLITAQMSSAAHQSSIGGVRYSKATPSSSPSYNQLAPFASTVEQCTCGAAYTGSSCEACASGYYRNETATHPYFGTCILCDCNGHSGECDANTGECLDCQHDTEGFNCELCAIGFYGDATLGTAADCTQCPCSPPKALNASCEVINEVVTCTACAPGHLTPLCNICADFHYGQPQLPDGFCTPCNCTGNSEQCDTVTGQCLNCRDGTTGTNCERCDVMTYGDAAQQNCQVCSCHPIGSSSDLCDHVTGQCPCKPGIGNRACDSCQENFYGFGNEGCTDCACNEFGSLNLQCNEAGICSCFAGVLGAKCDMCEARTYGLPTQACTGCGCDNTGTIGGAAAICDPVSGQCPCRPGVGMRQCNQCALGFIELTAAGCTKCDKCVETLLNTTYVLDDMSTELWSTATLVGQLQERDVELQRLEPEANRTITQLTETVDSYSQLRSEIQQIDMQQYFTDINILLNDGQATLNMTLELLLEAGTHIQRISDLQLEAELIYNGSLIANATVMAYNEMLSDWTVMANTLFNSAVPRVQLIQGTSYDVEQGLIEAESARSRNVTNQAVVLHASIDDQAMECNRLGDLVNNAAILLEEIQVQVDDVNLALGDIDYLLTETDMLIAETVELVNYAGALYVEAQQTLDAVGVILGMAQSDILDGNKAFDDVVTIRDGAPNNGPVPVVDPSLVGNPGAITSWIRGKDLTISTIDAVQQTVSGTVTAQVAEAESRSALLENDAQQIQTMYQDVQPNSQTAVVSIEMYRDVLTVLEEATTTSQQAASTINNVQTSLATRSVEALGLDAAASRQSSLDLRSNVDRRSTNVQALDDSLSAANMTLIEAEDLWLGLEDQSSALIEQAEVLNNLAINPGIQPAINQGTSDSNRAIDLSQAITTGSNQLDATLVQNRQDIVKLQETVGNATNLNTNLPVVVSTAEADLAELDSKVSSLQTIQTETGILRGNITSKMAALREKLRLAQEIIANTRQPVRFVGQSSITVDRQVGQEAATLFNELQLEFKADQRDGLLFFTENPETNAFFSLEIVTSYLQFKFNVRDDVVTIQSPIVVCCGEWYKAIATRYEDEGQLSVVKLSTGGASVNHNSSINTYDRYLTFPDTGAKFYVGGLPRDYRTTKSLSRDFEGCIANVQFEHALDLWRPDSQEGSTSCCEGPQLPDTPPPEIVPGIGFTGFGYLELEKQSFDVFDQAGVSFKFRTFLQDAVLFLVSRSDLLSYIGVYVNNGKVVYEMTTSGNAKYTITSENNYNDANWYQVMVSYNQSRYNMDIYNVSDSGALVETFSRNTLAPLRFSNLQYSPKVILGAHISALPLPAGTDPTEFTHGPNGLPFAGAMTDVMLSNGTTELVPRPLTNETAKQYQGVTFNGVMAEVAPGIGFKGQYAFAKLRVPNLLRLTESISFSFKTFEPHGILAYAYDGQSFNKLIYVVLYHGNIFLQYNIGEGRSEPLQTRGLRLNTGQWQSVSIDFTGISASLKVNDLPTLYGNRQVPTQGIPITASNSYLYVGGVPGTTPVLIGGEFSVRRSINSGIDDFAVNGQYINFNDPNVVVMQEGMDLSGISPEVITLPPLPYPTEPPSTGPTPPATCSARVPLVYDPNIARLGSTTDGYMAFTLPPAIRESLQISFVMKMRFRTVSPNGILFFAGNSNVRTTQFMALILLDGKLSFSIITSSRAMTGLNINSKQRYDNGYWQEVLVLRINDFVAMLIQETDDYVNNGISTEIPSSLTIATDLYIGGLGPEVINSVLTISDTFDGCIAELEISFTNAAPFLADFSAPTSMQGVTQCLQNEVEPGASFNGTGSWIQLENNFVVNTNLEVRMMIRTTDQSSALLLAVSSNTQNFFAVDIYDGSVRVAISHGNQSPYIVRSTQMSSIFSICDGLLHEIVVRFQSSQLTLIVDGREDVTLFTPGTPRVNTNHPLYIGGIPNSSSRFSVGGLSTDSFLGCVQSVAINGVERVLRNHISSAGIITGCPLPPS